MKKIIIISPHDVFPPSNGGERRIYLLIKELTEKNNITFLGPKLKNKTKIQKIEIIELFENKAKNKNQ